MFDLQLTRQMTNQSATWPENDMQQSNLTYWLQHVFFPINDFFIHNLVISCLIKPDCGKQILISSSSNSVCPTTIHFVPPPITSHDFFFPSITWQWPQAEPLRRRTSSLHLRLSWSGSRSSMRWKRRRHCWRTTAGSASVLPTLPPTRRGTCHLCAGTVIPH